MSYYLSTLAVYFFIDLLLAYALNMQLGWGGIPNFALIMFQAVGAYAASVVSLGPDTGVNAFQRYVSAPRGHGRCPWWQPRRPAVCSPWWSDPSRCAGSGATTRRPSC